MRGCLGPEDLELRLERDEELAMRSLGREFQTEGPTGTNALRWKGVWHARGTEKRPELLQQREGGAEEKEGRLGGEQALELNALIQFFFLKFTSPFPCSILCFILYLIMFPY